AQTQPNAAMARAILSKYRMLKENDSPRFVETFPEFWARIWVRLLNGLLSSLRDSRQSRVASVISKANTTKDNSQQTQKDNEQLHHHVRSECANSPREPEAKESGHRETT